MKLKQFAAPNGRQGESAQPGLRLAVWVLTLASAAGLIRVSYNTATAAGSQHPQSVKITASLSKTSAIRFENAGNRRINLSGSNLLTSYEGSQEAIAALDRNEATPLAAASDDFDEDGVPDLVCAYASPGGGILALHLGNVDSIYPNAPEAKQRRAEGKFTDAPFLASARVFEAPQATEFIGAGDFDADDHRDLVAAKIGGNALWFYRGNGHGTFAEARQIILPGAVTALEVGEINRRDGLADIVVGITSAAGAQALVFESPLGAAGARPEAFALPAPAASLALGEIVGSYEQDLAIAAGNQLIVLNGRDRKLSFEASNQPPVVRPKVSSRSFDFNIKSLVIGNFRGDNHTDIALLGDDGSVRIGRNPAPASSKRKKTTLAGWRTKLLKTDQWPMASKIMRARVSSNPTDSLLVLDSASHRLNIIDQQPEVTSKTSALRTPASSAGGPMVSSLVSDGEVTAVLPMRLNSDALNDLVALNRRRASPMMIFSVSATFTVNSTGETSDASPGNGVCDDGGGNCTLRAAIQEANASAGVDAINFSIGSGTQTITLGASLPSITEAVTIDGTTQPGFPGTPIIELDCTNVLENALQVVAGNTTIRGLVINRVPASGDAILLDTGGSNIIEGNYIGSDVSGSAGQPNGRNGVSMNNSSANRIGGTVAAARNLIGHNNGDGLKFLDSSDNIVQGNFIGTDVTGAVALGNGTGGVSVAGIAQNITIGGSIAAAMNVISGNTGNGVELSGASATNNLIQGNHIGTNAAGTAALANTNFGVSVDGASGNTIGGTAAGAQNLISGNNGTGVHIINSGASGNFVQGNLIGTNAAGTAAIPNTFGIIIDGAPNNTIGGTMASARNIISGNGGGQGVVIQLAGATGNAVQGNFIGTDITGASSLGNAAQGVSIANSAASNTIGGTVAGALNVISGNNGGIDIDTSSSNNLVQGNFIGTNASGTAAIANTASGVGISGSGNTVGGTAAAARNIVSGNGGNGINLLSGSANNTIQGNFVGLDVSGATAIPNSLSGIVVIGSNNLVGGTTAGARNVSSGNVLTGIHLLTNTAINNTVQGNFTGTNAAGTAAVPNNRDGIRITGGLNNLVGGTAVGAGNVISGNPVGFSFLSSANGNTVQGNFIGTLSDGTTPLPNTGDGVNIDTNSSNNTIGGTAAGAANIIAFNSARGINVVSGTGNGLLANSIFSNASLGIDLNQDGVTANDAGDADAGPNNLQNFPVLTSATPGAMTAIQGTLNSTANTAFRIEFFSNSACDPSGNGEGTTFLGFTNIITDGSGNASINVTLPVSVPAGNAVVATATDPSNNTSEFSACITVGVASCAITCPPNQTVSTATNQCGATVSYPAPTTTGSCGSVSCAPPSGTLFAVGTTTVTCVTGSGPTCSFSVTVVDDKPPLLACPQNLLKATDAGKATAVIDYVPAGVSDNCPGATVVCLPPSGFTAPLGATTVTCSAKDASNNTASCSFTVTVTDFEPPGIRCPANISVEIGPNQTSSVVNYPPPTVSDNLPNATVVCAPPSGATFPLGVTTVSCLAKDSVGNQASCGFIITVLGGTPTGLIVIPGGQPALEFGEVTKVPVTRKPPKARNLPCGLFSIRNSSLAPLRLTLASINRTGSDVDSGRISDAAEGNFYQLSEVLTDGSLATVAIGSTVTIAVGAQKNFCLKFGPTVPGLAGSVTGLRAPQAVPDVINSRVSFSAAGAGSLAANVMAEVETAVRLINPNKPKKPPVVSFSSSGDEFIASFAAFDPNMDVNKASFELLGANGQVMAGPFAVDLVQPIKGKNLVRGQSFSVEQRFTGARRHTEIKGVRVTVFDGETSAVGSTSLQPSSAAVAAQFGRQGGPSIVLPAVVMRRPASEKF